MEISKTYSSISIEPNISRALKPLVLVLLMVINFNALASVSRIDSLKVAVEEMPNDSLKCKTLLDIAFILYSGEESVAYARRAEKLAKNLKSQNLIAQSYTCLGWVVGFDKVDLKTAYLDSALNIFTQLNNSEGISRVYNTKSTILLEYDNLEEGIANLEIALKYSEKTDNKHQKAVLLNNYAVALLQLNRPIEAKAKYEEALEFRKVEYPMNKIATGALYFGLGNCAKALGDYQTSLKYYFKSYSYRHDVLNSATSESLIGMANTLYEAAEQHIDTIVLYDSLNAFGFLNSKVALDSATSIALRHGRPQFIPSIQNAHRRRALLNGNYKLAYELLFEEKEKNESYKLSASSLEGLADLKVKSEKDQLKIKLLEEELNFDRKKNQFNVLLFFLGIMVLVLVIGLLLFQNRLKAKHIEYTNAKQEQQNIAMLAMLEGQEKERARIARDLHDGLGNQLTSLKLNINNINPASENEQYLEQTNNMIDEACTEVRKIAHEMMPQALERLGLKKALKDQILHLDHRGEINAQFESYGEEKKLDDNSTMMLFRAAQEAINNIIKHAKASEVLLQLIYSEEWLNLTIEDDGKGFNPKKIKKGSGMGLRSMAFRIDSIGGQYEIDSRKGKGTLVSISIPLTRKPKLP